MIFCTIFTSLGQLFLKKGVDNFVFTLLGILRNSNFLIGLTLYAFGALLLIIALRGGELSVLYPIVATGYVWVSIMSIHYIGENMNIFKWTGLLFIIFGVSLIGYGSQHGSLRRMRKKLLTKIQV